MLSRWVVEMFESMSSGYDGRYMTDAEYMVTQEDDYRVRAFGIPSIFD
jgi:hypothetical protein